MQVRHTSISFEEMRLSDFGEAPLPPSDTVFPRSTQSVGLGPRPAHPTVEFDTPPTQVAAFLSGFRVWFEEHKSDRPLGKLEVRLGVPIKDTDTKYSIPVTFGLRDWSGDWDDRHAAEIHITVIAD